MPSDDHSACPALDRHPSRVAWSIVLCCVTGIYDWQVSNPATKKSLSRVPTFDYTVNMGGGTY